MRTVANLVDALNDHESTSAQCEEDLTSLSNIASGDEVDVEGRVGSKQRMASLGAIEGIIGVLWAHLSCAPVQEKGFLALHHLANGETCADDDAEARKLHMVDAAALETITSGMRLHVRSAAVELLGLDVLSSIATVSGGEEARAYCMRRLEAAGAIEATVAALQAHSACVKLHERGFGVLCDMSSGEENVIADRLQRMVEAVFHITPPRKTQSCLQLSAKAPPCFHPPPVSSESRMIVNAGRLASHCPFHRISEPNGRVRSPPRTHLVPAGGH